MAKLRAATARLADPARITGIAGIRLTDVTLTLVVIAAVELFVATASGPGQQPLTPQAYLIGAGLAVPILFRRRWPLQVLISCALLLVVYYATARRNIPPTPLLSVPVYAAAAAGYLAWAIAVPALFIAAGLAAAALSHHPLHALAAEFLPRLAGVPLVLWLLPTAIFPLAVVLGELVRGRRALAAETTARLRAADDEREAEAARKVAEERLRIARELHDTVAHSMATITVQAGSALHLLAEEAEAAAREICARDAQLREALAAIRTTSKNALTDMRASVGQLRPGGAADQPASSVGSGPGLHRLDALRAAVGAAGVPVTIMIDGAETPLPDEVDHAAYRIVQESLTNVLRHGGPDTAATVRLVYDPDGLTLDVADDGVGSAATADPDRGPSRAGHGLAGMAERAAAVGGSLTAGPRPGGGFAVNARLPVAQVHALSEERR